VTCHIGGEGPLHSLLDCARRQLPSSSTSQASVRRNSPSFAELPEGIPHFIYGPLSDRPFERLPDGWTVVPAGYRPPYWIPEHEGGSE